MVRGEGAWFDVHKTNDKQILFYLHARAHPKFRVWGYTLWPLIPTPGVHIVFLLGCTRADQVVSSASQTPNEHIVNNVM